MVIAGPGSVRSHRFSHPDAHHVGNVSGSASNHEEYVRARRVTQGILVFFEWGGGGGGEDSPLHQPRRSLRSRLHLYLLS